MEAVPRLPMICFQMRTSLENVDFSAKLTQYIRNHYNEDPTLYAAAMTGIDSLRREAVNPSKSIAGCSIMKRYYCQLYLMSNRFPMREDEEVSVQYSWQCDHSACSVTMTDVSLELVSILYNIGALHAQLGAMDNRTSAEGMKMSCTHFQCAAWAFQHITEEYPYVKSLGLSPVLLSFMCQVCLAQAQECILEKSIVDNRKSAITAKIGIQVVEYYKQSLNLLAEWPKTEEVPSDYSGTKTYKNWNKYLHFKIAYYESLSLLFQGQQAEDQQKMGERVTYYQAAFEKLEEVKKLPPGVEDVTNVAEALAFVQDVIEAKRKAAKNENEFIYHESVPNLAHLPKIKGASLVKGIPFNINDPEVCGPDLFSSIVPMEAHESSSMYSEEKAKLLRRVNGMIENKDEELETFLSTLDLDDIKSKNDGNKLPQELIDRCASLSAKPDAIEQLIESMNKLSDVYQDVGSMLSEIKEMLKQEESHEKEYQQVLGERPPSIAATDLTREAKKYQEAHAKASESNQTLHKAMVMHISNLKLLSLPLKELMNQIPAVADNPEVEAIIKEMEHLMGKVDEMKKQRLMLASQLRDLIRQDDITRQLITYSGDNVEELFEQELKKYDKNVSLIEQNLAAQENILRAMKDAYARYGSTRKSTGESHRKRMMMISSLIASCDAYDDLLAKSSKGLDFYKKLETNVSKLLQRVKGTCKVQDEEREEMLKSVKKLDSVVPQSEAPATNTLKLKDYLNIKKETGKLSLSHPPAVPSPSPHYNEMGGTHPQHSWIPDARPAPVGSEETDNSYRNSSDSFCGFYQNQGKDQVWNTPNYSSPQNSDHKLKYFVPQANDSYSANSQNTYPCTRPPDAYPISSYSTVLPKAEGTTSYEPKSNYYDVSSSPHRYYNPIQSYGEAVIPSTNMSYAVSEVNCIQPSHNVPDVSPYYAYSSPMPVTYGVSQQPNVVAESYETPESLENQARSGPAYNPLGYSQRPVSFNISEAEQFSYASGTRQQTLYQDPNVYNPYTSVQNPTSVGHSAVSTSNYFNTSSYTPSYPTSLPQPASGTMGSSLSQEKINDYQNIQNYQTTTSTYVPDNQGNLMPTPQSTYSYPASVSPSYPPFQSTEIPAPYGQSTNSVESWPRTMPAPYNQPCLQSGNDSVYTASQLPNHYAMTNSDVYKSYEPQNLNHLNQGTLYYNSQYGAYSGQAEINSQNGYPATYIQAGNDKQHAVTTTTFSLSESKSSPVTNPSNVDLLAGLDFNISHCPLVPEMPVKKDEKTEKPETGGKSSPEAKPETVSEPPPEKPLKLNVEEGAEEKKTRKNNWMTSNPEKLDNFRQEVEKYEKFVEGLTLKTLSGPTNLDTKWKEVVDIQDKLSSNQIISVARCYPMKNRFPDILPYDNSRVELPSTKDDYINASRMPGPTQLSPPFILTQAPLPSTYVDFWVMVFEQQAEVIVCLLSDAEIDGHVYWPVERNQELEAGKLKISLQSSNHRSHWVERILSVSVAETRATRVVVHLQFTGWPGSSFPESPGSFLSFTTECTNYFNQQRSYNHPVIVHCISGVGRTGLFCLLVASVLDIQAGNGIPDLASLSGRMCQYRKSCLRDREHLKFAYQSVLYYCQDILKKRGIFKGNLPSTFGADAEVDEKKHVETSFASTTIDDQLQNEMKHLNLSTDSGANQVQENRIADNSNTGISGFSVPAGNSGQFSNVLSALNPADFTLKTPQTNERGKKFTSDMFNKGSGGGTSLENNSSDDDPLNRLDPLWSMKK